MELQNIATLEMIKNIVGGTTPVARAEQAYSATRATQDGQGRNIASTYATKSEVGGAVYWHNIYANAFNVETGIHSALSFYITIQVLSSSPVKFTAASFLSWLKNNGFTDAATNFYSCSGVAGSANNGRAFFGCCYVTRAEGSESPERYSFMGIRTTTGVTDGENLTPDDFDNFIDTVFSI